MRNRSDGDLHSREAKENRCIVGLKINADVQKCVTMKIIVVCILKFSYF